MADNLMKSDHCIVNPTHIRYYMALPCFHVEILRCSLCLSHSLSIFISVVHTAQYQIIQQHMHITICLTLEELKHIFFDQAVACITMQITNTIVVGSMYSYPWCSW